ncbi:hypothetical protein BOO69_11075 [Sulfitobacter alexandrii]|uniref:Dienelactone hydrolase n=1 Tax=Sulfitobacter alexandrii TaxID=1917485 RepID=A0A1J0WHT7_9RHOB|nr:hypothetical protein [Sulfitobacter alexandrii]APE43889.1 hypothetical protein BOO69_11075 [Sulfitobacter alexandrii]
MKYLVLLLLALCPLIAVAEPAPGVARLAQVGGPERQIDLTIWYPSDTEAAEVVGGNAVFRGATAAPAAPLPTGRLPLVIVSHGGLRSATDSGAWLSAALARRDMIAVEVNGPRVTGAGDAVDEIWQRPRDIVATMDRVLSDPVWSRHVDTNRISVVGFALGGTAALLAGGARIDPAIFAASCDGAGGPDCGWLERQGRTLADVRRDRLDRMRGDPRVASVVAVAPEYRAAWQDGMGRMSAPAHIVRLGAPGGPAPDGATLAAIPDAAPADAFAVCTETGSRILREDGGDPALCASSPDARRAVHARLLDQVLEGLAARTRQ